MVKSTTVAIPTEPIFRSIFENAQIGISVFDIPAGQFHTNEAAHKLLGCTHENRRSSADGESANQPAEPISREIKIA
jgi:hypothetical protein